MSWKQAAIVGSWAALGGALGALLAGGVAAAVGAAAFAWAGVGKK